MIRSGPRRPGRVPTGQWGASSARATRRRGALAIQAHLEIALGGMADPVTEQRGQPLPGKCERRLHQEISRSLVGPERGHVRGDGERRRVEEEADEIEGVGAELEQGGPSELGPPASFAGRGVEHLLPALDEIEAPELARRDPLTGHPVEIHEAVLVVHGQEAALGLGRADDAIGIRGGLHEGLLAEHVTAVLDGEQAQVAMGVGRRGHHDQIRPLVLEQHGRIGVETAHAEAAAHALAPGGIGLARGHDLDAAQAVAGRKVEALGHAPQSHDGHADRRVLTAHSTRPPPGGWIVLAPFSSPRPEAPPPAPPWPRRP